MGKFSEGGRGLPVTLSRPQGALPYSPLVRQAYAPQPKAHLGWGQGIVTVGDCMLEPARPLAPSDPLKAAAQQMLRDESGLVPVCENGRFLGVVYIDAVLKCVADDRTPPSVAQVLST